jgi:hypothetical protein
MNRIDNISDKDKLWELYLHTLAGYHGNVGANAYKQSELEEAALNAAEKALKVWKREQK